ncbi:unnamed protein product [Phytomonas sp. EM1]|nr:unnamed protein product [Phytomonas sp. EM1]|eukprot:CCW59912.1 unnamed protein product [Phytomonas sp. isolate EM1]
MDITPHYYKVKDIPESLNPITGRSIYYGIRPWRCDDRFQDWLKSFISFDGIGVQFQLLKTLYKCIYSEKGAEPVDSYHRLGRSEVMFYVERYRSGMMRERFWETYPYDQNELVRIAEEDGMKMRVWRHQRELEIQSREGKLDELLQKSIFKQPK